MTSRDNTNSQTIRHNMKISREICAKIVTSNLYQYTDSSLNYLKHTSQIIVMVCVLSMYVPVCACVYNMAIMLICSCL